MVGCCPIGARATAIQIDCVMWNDSVAIVSVVASGFAIDCGDDDGRISTTHQ